MVKLQKRFSYKYKDKDHYKHLVTIPDEIINQLNWKEGIELEPIVSNGKLLLQIKEN
jgi:bifunctional DNA-binding transcriptional regulator/antitoxin component of YhaV-PrlF toxin-antitoxin module